MKKGVYSSSNLGEGLSWKYWKELRMEEGWTAEGCYNPEEEEASTSGKIHE